MVKSTWCRYIRLQRDWWLDSKMAVQVEVKRLLFQRLQQHLVSVVGSLVLSSLLRSCRKPFMHIWVNSLSHVLSAVSGAKASFCSGVRDKFTKRHRDRCHTAQLCRRKVLNKFVRKGRKGRKSCEGLRWDQRVRAGGLPETYLRNICPLPPSPTSPSYHFPNVFVTNQWEVPPSNLLSSEPVSFQMHVWVQSL